MRDKQGQQRRWRADGAIRSSVDRRPMGEDPALASSSTFAATRRTATRLRPQGARRHFVDSAQRRSLAGFARRVPLASHVLAQTARLGRARCLAQYLAGVSSRAQRTETTAVERVFPGREFCSRQKGAPESEKPSGARARSGWWWSTARVFLWESTFVLHPRTKRGSRKRRSRRSA